MKLRWWCSAKVLALVAFTLVAIPRAVPGAELSEGLEIDPQNVESYGEFLGPGLAKIVADGVSLRVAASSPIPSPPPFLAATKLYASRVSLAEDASEVFGYVAGLPFQRIDAGDPQAAERIMFNFSAAVLPDEAELRGASCDSGTINGGEEAVSVARHFLLDRYQLLRYRGRTVVPPLPVIERNANFVQYIETGQPLIEPFDLKGTAFTSYHYANPKRLIDTWLYLPQLRRVRRLSTAQRSDALFGQDVDLDSFRGFSGNVGDLGWRLFGERTVLGFFDAKIPVLWRAPPADFLPQGDGQPRRVWVVEGTPRYPHVAYSKRVLYIDQENWHAVRGEYYNAEGELWKVALFSYAYASRPTEDAKTVFDYKKLFPASVTMVDLQTKHVTFCALPGGNEAFGQGWYVNHGQLTATYR